MNHAESRLQSACVGIDPGTKTGVAVWDRSDKGFINIDTMTITKAFDFVKSLKSSILVVRIEDARKRTWFGNSGKERLKGAGSVERDCSIWEQFCKEQSINYELVHPKNNNTKLSADSFSALTKWTGRTSEHSRDAAMLVFGM